MHAFSISRAGHLADAITAHALDPQLAFIAGGTDLIGLMKDRAAVPEHLLHINGLPNMAAIHATPAGGLALAAMDAIVLVRGPAGERRIRFTDFHQLPGSTPERDNVLARGDLIIAIEVPANPEAYASHYLKVRDRASYEFALVSAAAAIAR